MQKVSVDSSNTITITRVARFTPPDATNSYGGGICRVPNTNEFIYYSEEGVNGDGYTRQLGRYNDTTKVFAVSPSTTYLPNGTYVYGLAYSSNYVYLFIDGGKCLKYNATTGAYVS